MKLNLLVLKNGYKKMKIPHTGLEGNVSDHKFRSGYVQWLLHQEGYRNNKKIKIPRVIIQFWDKLEELPEDVEKCLNSWHILKEFRFRVSLFSDKSARKFIQKEYPNEYVIAYDKCEHPAMKSDYFRLCYIYKCGGAYVDADEILIDMKFIEYFNNNNLKIQPLCFDLAKNEMVNFYDYIEDKSYPNKKIFYVNNNPIICPSKHMLIKLALEDATNNLINHKLSSKFDIQSTTGPGNLTANLVSYSMQLKNKIYDFEIIRNWDIVSKCEWFLSYRDDERNWRNY